MLLATVDMVTLPLEVRAPATGLLLLAGALLACKGDSSAACSGAIEIEGQRYSAVGTGSSEQEAKKNAISGACMIYCEAGDPLVESAYRRWKATPEGQRSRMRRSSEIAFNRKLKKVHEVCVVRCRAALSSGQATAKVRCK